MKTITQAPDGTVRLYDDGINWEALTDLDREIILELASCSMIVSETARQLYMHRNTVVYHLGRVKKLTGLDPLNFYDLHRLVQYYDKEA